MLYTDEYPNADRGPSVFNTVAKISRTTLVYGIRYTT